MTSTTAPECAIRRPRPSRVCSKGREEGWADPGALRFALATAASLIFPFAPHVGADAYFRLTGDRVWEQPWPDADPEMLRYFDTVGISLDSHVRVVARRDFHVALAWRTVCFSIVVQAPSHDGTV